MTRRRAAGTTARREEAAAAASRILADVRRRGDAAVLRYERRFNSESRGSLRLSRADVRAAYSRVGAAQMRALRLAASRLERTERATMSLLRSRTTSSGGVRVTRSFEPIRSAGCYVPGGLARYPSTAVMCVVPARVAGVPRIAVASPPGPGGEIDPLTVAAADMCGAHEIYRMGGAQAVAALAYGTESVAAVDKIVGPGGLVVTEAKRLVSGSTGIDMLAGPTELCIIADSSADPAHVALDLASQAEHGGDSACHLVTDSRRLARAVEEELRAVVSGSERSAIIRESLRRNGTITTCRTSEMAAMAESMAPEHLQVMTRDPERTARGITTPGIILLGHGTPSAASDYMLGTNHVLPTGGTGAFRGSLSVLDFAKLATRATASRRAITSASPHVGALAGAEGLHAHRAAVEGRL